MLEILKNTFERNYENSFFREISRHLYKVFEEKKLSGVFIGSPLCNLNQTLQIDVLLVTSNVVCIIDFKNYGGKITLPDEKNFERGFWESENGSKIKGGSSVNPFIQLKNQKAKFFEISKKYIQRNIKHPNKFDASHIIRMVCFHEKTEITGKIPPHESLNFFIKDRSNIIEGLLDILDVNDGSVSLDDEAFSIFKKVFRADKYDFDEKTPEYELEEIADKSENLNFENLYEDQKESLEKIKTFLEDPEKKIFILKGTTNSGKSHLIPYIQELAYKCKSEIDESHIFASSSRVARNLLTLPDIEKVNSLYAYIYGGIKNDTEDSEADIEEDTETVEENISEELEIEVVPLKRCMDSENALFIVDESQLVSDSFYQSIDLIFGTGHLLSDFIGFSKIDKTKRKIIFIGDPFQICTGKSEESSLCYSYIQENLKLNTDTFQLSDKENFSDITDEALKCVKKIRSGICNSLHFNSGNHFNFLKKEDKYSSVNNLIQNKVNGHILCYTNEEAFEFNNWIKKSIVKNGDEITKGDLVMFNNNFSIGDKNDPTSLHKKIFNGQFGIVEEVSNSTVNEARFLKGNILASLDFREITVLLPENGHKVKVLSLENYRLSPKGELSVNELKVLKILLNTEIYNAKKSLDYKDSKEFIELINTDIFIKRGGIKDDFISKILKRTSTRKDLSDEEYKLNQLVKLSKKNYNSRIKKSLATDPSSKYFKYRNAAMLRYGWAMTVHKSISYKWDEIIFDIDQGENKGRTNDSYFKWIYTGVSRARNKVNLINYRPVTPFEKTEFKDNNSGVKPKDIYFLTENIDKEEKLKEFEKFISGKLSDTKYKIILIEHKNYQEIFNIGGENKETLAISIYYKNDGKFNPPTVIRSLPEELGEDVIKILKKNTRLRDLKFIKDKWRQSLYEDMEKELNKKEISFEMIIQTNYKDKIKLFRNKDELDIEVDYTKTGLVNSLTAKYFSDISLWEDLKDTIQNYKSIDSHDTL